MAQLFNLLKQNLNAKGGGVQELAVVVINMLYLSNKALASEFRRQLSNMIAV